MTEGTTAPFHGLAVPLFGESEIRQSTAADDILTIRGASGQSGSYIVCQISDGTEKFVVGSSGNVTLAGTLAVTGASSFGTSVTWSAVPVFNGTIVSAAPTTGMTTGEFFFFTKENVLQLGFAFSDAVTHRVVMSNN